MRRPASSLIPSKRRFEVATRLSNVQPRCSTHCAICDDLDFADTVFLRFLGRTGKLLESKWERTTRQTLYLTIEFVARK